MNPEKKIMGMSLEDIAKPKDDFSLAIQAFGGSGEFNSHRMLRLIIGKDGSIYLSMMKIQGEDKEWQVKSAPFSNDALTRNFDLTSMSSVGIAVTPKFSFHASGAINVGQHRTYRPPLCTLRNTEQLCLIQYGNPGDLPAINTEKFNSWQKKRAPFASNWHVATGRDFSN